MIKMLQRKKFLLILYCYILISGKLKKFWCFILYFENSWTEKKLFFSIFYKWNKSNKESMKYYKRFFFIE